MEMGLRVLGQRTSTSRPARLADYGLLVSGGATGGALTAGLLSVAGAVVGLKAVAVYALPALLVAIAVLTVRRPTRELGWHRQVARHSSFGVTRPRPQLFLWGIELGSGVATVITHSSTLVVLALALLAPIPAALLIGGAAHRRRCSSAASTAPCG